MGGADMRRIARVDANQSEIIGALIACGCSVHPLHQVGGGVPDILVGHRGRNILMEIKDGRKPPSERKLTQDQQEWHSRWRGQVIVVTNSAEAIAALVESPKGS